MPLVKIKPGLSHGYRAADGSHAYYRAGDEFDASPAEMESFGDKFVLIVEPPVDEIVSEPEPPAVEINATPGARKLAQEHSISLALSDIVGSGKDGKITKADVRRLLDNMDDTEASLEAAGRLMQPDHLASLTGDDIEAPLNGDDAEALLTGDDLGALPNGDAE